MINIVIPIAGAGSRFVDAEFTVPKPFIDVYGVAMIERVLDNLKMDNARFILIARDEHLVSEKASFERLGKKYNCEFLTVDKLTEGAACTILLSCWLIMDGHAHRYNRYTQCYFLELGYLYASKALLGASDL